jgi:hypothetical protein
MNRTLLLTLLLLPAVAAAQARPLPAGWQVRADQTGADLSKLSFETMAPGWHVTTGPTVILWEAGKTAPARFELQAEIFFFREGSRDTEGYGVLFGGKQLDQPEQSYLYFLVRNDGKYLVRHRGGSEVHTITEWTEHPAIARHTGQSGPTVKNVLTVSAGADSVRIYANGQQLNAYPTDHMKADGLTGLRISHGLNLHVSKLDLK